MRCAARWTHACGTPGFRAVGPRRTRSAQKKRGKEERKLDRAFRCLAQMRKFGERPTESAKPYPGEGLEHARRAPLPLPTTAPPTGERAGVRGFLAIGPRDAIPGGGPDRTGPDRKDAAPRLQEPTGRGRLARRAFYLRASFSCFLVAPFASFADNPLHRINRDRASPGSSAAPRPRRSSTRPRTTAR